MSLVLYLVIVAGCSFVGLVLLAMALIAGFAEDWTR